ncbi:amidase family protein [Undibacterium sp. TS12]|uniref:amidase family protein n=1 Tax=Undibacterium sp. TS12 TaxID=2908202 RepID=UPI001F4CE711|nr:amidase family protein [Undibacterium sp. TS12]MCH8618083.1 amidase family protein [Undibacterium sp. TS12]
MQPETCLPLHDVDASAQAALIQSGQISATELLEASIAQIEASNAQLNAIVTPMFEQARQQARGKLIPGPFSGVPYAIKDLVDVQGVRRSSGSRLLSSHVSDSDAAIVSQTRAAGLILLGKTNTPEFALNATTEAVLSGPARNPWNRAHSAGGSSGGAAVAVASGMLAFAHACDGGGSIRIPASCCGLFGLKPSRGRMQGSGMGDSGVEHCLSRSVRDSARLFAWNQRHDADAPWPAIRLPVSASQHRLKIAFALNGMAGTAPTEVVGTAVTATARLCAALGHHVETVQLPVNGELFFRHFKWAWSHSAQRAFDMAREMGKDPEQELEAWTNYLAAHARAAAPEAAGLATAYFSRVAQDFAGFFEDYDVLLSPVTSMPAPRLGYFDTGLPGEVLWERLQHYAAYTPMHNIAGTPAMSVPLGMSHEGLPIGSQFAARAGDEQTLFELAFELEQAQAWSHLRPPPPEYKISPAASP